MFPSNAPSAVCHPPFIRTSNNVGAGDQRNNPWRKLVWLAVAIFGIDRSGRAQNLFSDDFEPLAWTVADQLNKTTSNWTATPTSITIQNYGTPSSQTVQIPIVSATPSGFMQPTPNTGGTKTAASWPLGRTCEKFLRVQFDLGAFGTGIGAPDSVMNLVFSPGPLTGSTDVTNGDDGPWAALQISKAGSSAKVQIRARHQGNGTTKGTIDTVGSEFIIGGFTSGNVRTFRVDFGWDYFRFPRKWQLTQNEGRRWFDLRLTELVNGNWVALTPPTSPTDPAVSNGWVEFGSVQTTGSYGRITDAEKGFTLEGWPFQSGTSTRVVYLHWYFDQGGNPSGSTTWYVDNVKIAQITGNLGASTPFPDLQPFSLMSNQIGYDTAGPQWVALRPNDPDVRGLGATAISSITWTLVDPANPSNNLTQTFTNPVGVQGFNEVIDYEEWGSNLSNPTYTTAPVYWWTWAWSPRTTDWTGRYVTADGTLSTGFTFHAQSDPFDIHPNICYTTLVSDPNHNLAVQNGSNREAVTTGFSRGPTYPGDPGGGWFDAGNENGENRAHACFVSGLCSVLRRRRAHLSTAEIRSYIHEIQVGADFLINLGPSENAYVAALPTDPPTRNTNHTDTSNREKQSHHLDGTPSSDELAGHIFHEHHTRYLGQTSSQALSNGDLEDSNNSDISMLMSCAGLADAARTLQPFAGTANGSSYFSQAINTRSYLYALASMYGKAPDFYVPYRAGAMIDLLVYSYNLVPGDLNDARYKLTQDLIKFQPTTSANVGPWWTVAGLLKNSASSAQNTPRQVDPSAFAAVEPLLYCVENNVPDWPQTPQPHATWQQALASIYSNWYQSQLSTPTFANPLKIGWTWNLDTSPAAFYGEQSFFDKYFASEALNMAQLAQYFGRASTQFGPLVTFSSGSLNWLLGINMGILARHVQAATGIAENDLERAGVSFISATGRHYSKQVIDAEHQWTHPTVVTGVSGHPEFSNGTFGTITNWNAAPFSYSRSEYHSAESFIKTDGILLAALEQFGRNLHPFKVVEAENYSSAAIAGGGTPVVQANNVPATIPVGGYPNGGSSVVGLVQNDSLTFSGLMPPEPVLPNLATTTFHYRVRLRVSNSNANPGTISVVVTQGATSTSKTFSSVPSTGNVHEYAVVDDGTGFSLALLSGTTFSFTITLGSPGPFALDDVVFESDGIGM